jgi:hypothetical protein
MMSHAPNVQNDRAPTVQRNPSLGKRGLRRPFVFDSALLDKSIARSGFNLEELAIEANVDKTTIWRARHRKAVSWKVTGDICSALNVGDPEELRAKQLFDKPPKEVVSDLVTLIAKNSSFLAELKEDKNSSLGLHRQVTRALADTIETIRLSETEPIWKNEEGCTAVEQKRTHFKIYDSRGNLLGITQRNSSR